MQLLTDLLAYAVAAAAVIFALAAVTTRKLFRAVIALMGTLAMGAAIYLFQSAEFLAGVQVLVYVGGIVVVLIFAVMLTSATELQEDVPLPGRRLTGLLVAAAFFAVTRYALLSVPIPPPPAEVPVPVTGAVEIGKALLDAGPEGYVLPFEVVSLLLLAAAIGAIVISRRQTDTRPAGPVPQKKSFPAEPPPPALAAAPQAANSSAKPRELAEVSS